MVGRLPFFLYSFRLAIRTRKAILFFLCQKEPFWVDMLFDFITGQLVFRLTSRAFESIVCFIRKKQSVVFF